MEKKYQKCLSKTRELCDDNVKLLLPIKTKDGSIKKQHGQRVTKENLNKTQNNTLVKAKKKKKNNLKKFLGMTSNEAETVLKESVPMVQLLASREKKISLYKFKIGKLANDALEDPSRSISNLTSLLQFMNERDPDVYLTVRRYATISLLEIFQDLMPSYPIRDSPKSERTHKEGMLKKETLQLHNFESSFLKFYKQYLKHLEKMANILKNKQMMYGALPREVCLGSTGLKCMCILLKTKTHFNFTSNIALFLVPFLNNQSSYVRQYVKNCFVDVFKQDKIGELSLKIVQSIKRYISSRDYIVHSEVFSVLLGLRISENIWSKEKEVNSDKNKKKKIKSKITHDMKKLKKDLTETEAKENIKKANFTKITENLYAIYIHSIKQSETIVTLSSCLKGLARFSHCINIDFYPDLVNVLNDLLERDFLSLNQQLHCIHSALVILNRQASIVHIDPTRFQAHLYKKILDINAGNSRVEMSLIVKTLIQIIVRRFKVVTPNVVLGFIKRIFTSSLALEHNWILELINTIKSVMFSSRGASNLVETECDTTITFQVPEELDSPENSTVYGTCLWETIALQRHYHPLVQVTAKNIVKELAGKSNEQSLNQLSKFSQESQKHFDALNGFFLPQPSIPKELGKMKKKHCLPGKLIHITNLEMLLNTSKSDSSLNIHKELKNC